ncbi:hypothetical protein [Caballeronia arationis]|uniref:hypothetical protein n=1 Tax=Caballeronia arationis TaxID=1777142 RepID=UPI000A7ED35C|nr:hypothetical protein [Caballeronia arationis]
MTSGEQQTHRWALRFVCIRERDKAVEAWLREQVCLPRRHFETIQRALSSDQVCAEL